MSGDITLQPTDSHEIHRSRALPTCPAQYQLGPLATGLARSLPAWPARYRLGPLATGLARSLPAWPARYRLGPLATDLARSLPAWPARYRLGPLATGLARSPPSWPACLLARSACVRPSAHNQGSIRAPIEACERGPDDRRAVAAWRQCPGRVPRRVKSNWRQATRRQIGSDRRATGGRGSRRPLDAPQRRIEFREANAKRRPLCRNEPPTDPLVWGADVYFLYSFTDIFYSK